jgi:hypothetical protein
MKMLTAVFWVVTPRGLVGSYRCSTFVLQMEVKRSSKNNDGHQQATWRHNPQDSSQHITGVV